MKCHTNNKISAKYKASRFFTLFPKKKKKSPFYYGSDTSVINPWKVRSFINKASTEKNIYTNNDVLNLIYA